jgi:hypothetical protein
MLQRNSRNALLLAEALRVADTGAPAQVEWIENACDGASVRTREVQPSMWAVDAALDRMRRTMAMAYKDIEHQDLRVCKKCGAAVPVLCTEDHEAWHEKLRKAVDEGGTLD